MIIQHSLDCSGQLCPAPILMTEEKIAELAPGETLSVVFTDPGAEPDLKAWCRATGHRALSFEGPAKDGKRIARIKKRDA